MMINELESRMIMLTGYSGMFFLTTISLAWRLSTVCFVLLSLFAVYHFLKSRPGLTRDQVIFCLPIIIFYVAAWMSYLANESPPQGPRILFETFAILVFSMPLLLLFSHYAPGRIFVWGMFVLGTITAAIFSILGWWIEPAIRAGGSSGQPVLFATLVLSQVAVVAAGYPFLSTVKWFGKPGVFITLGLGILTIVLSGSRGAWIAVPVLSIVILWFQFESRNRYLKVAAILFTVIVIPALVYQVPYVEKRVITAIDEASIVMTEPEDIGKSRTSVGIRVALWRAAIDIFSENMVFGVGPGSFKMGMKDFSEEHETSP
jgi:O-antigen ligase